MPWTISLDPGFPHTVVAGAQGAGKTTLLATMAGALAIDLSPSELELIILCARGPGPLAPFLDLPHVKAAASHVRPREALRILDCLDTPAALTVIIADDLDALGPDGRAVTARLEAITSRRRARSRARRDGHATTHRGPHAHPEGEYRHLDRPQDGLRVRLGRGGRHRCGLGNPPRCDGDGHREKRGPPR